MKIFINILIILLLLASCKTTKQVSNLDSRIVEKVQIEQKTESTATESTQLKSKTDEAVTEKDSIVVEETEVYFTAPDSTGKQAIVKIVERTISSGKLREEIKKTETDQSSGKTNNQIATTNENKQYDSNLQSEVKTKEQKPNWPLNIGIGILIAIVGFVIIKFRWIFKI